MASFGHEVDSIDGNEILTWEIDNTSAAKGVIACCYIFVGVYGITWVSLALKPTGHICHVSLLTTTLGPCRVDLCIRSLPLDIPSQGCRGGRCRQLDL